jgi:hypothetical protein
LGIAADLHPADSLNQISSARGIPKRFKPKPSRSKERWRAAEIRLRAMLGNISSVSSLEKTWPEGNLISRHI